MTRPGRMRLFAPLLVVVLAFLAAPAGGQDADDASVDKDGWWNLYVGPREDGGGGEFPVAPEPPNVPRDAIAVGATRGTVDKVAAVGIVLDVEPGTPVRELQLVLREANAPGANINASTTSVFACPVTTIWTPVHNGRWVDRPGFDCHLGRVIGERTETGLWSFDLRDFGDLWLNEENPLPQHGVYIAVDPALGADDAQVSFRDITTGEVTISFQAGEPAAPPEATPVPGPVATAAPPPVVPAPDIGDVLPPPAVEAPSVEAAPEAETMPEAATPAPRTVEPAEPGFFGNIPVGAFLLLPVAIGLALVTSFALGPEGEPSGMGQRRGAVSRTLDQR